MATWDDQDPNQDDYLRGDTPQPQASAPRPRRPVTDPNDPRLGDPAYASDPDVLDFINARYGAGGTALTQPAGTPGWDPQQQAWKDAPGSTNTGGGDGGPGGTLSGLLSPFQGTFTSPTPNPYPDAPTFTPPGYTPPPAFVPDRFSAPTFEDAQSDPGYKFAADEGERALTQSKAAGGVLNTGGTLKDILAWGQNYAAQRYGDVYNRNYNTWQGNEGAKERAYATNYASQFVDPYKFAYQGALDTFNPKQSQWNTNMASTQRGNENDYANAYERFLQSFRQFQDQRDSTFDKSYKYFSG